MSMFCEINVIKASISSDIFDCIQLANLGDNRSYYNHNSINWVIIKKNQIEMKKG